MAGEQYLASPEPLNLNLNYFFSMASSAPTCSNCLSSAGLFHSQGRHFVTVMLLALIRVEHYNPSPIMVGYWFEGACLLPSMFALVLAFVGSKILSVACFYIDWILRQALQDYPGVQVGANIHVSDLAYAEDIVILSSSYSEMQGLLDAVNRHAAAVGMRINASKTKVMSAPI